LTTSSKLPLSEFLPTIILQARCLPVHINLKVSV
jgi:hypothetical protein